MKKKLKRVMSVVLVVTMAVCTVLSLDFSAAAAENAASEVGAVVTADDVSAEVEETPVAVEGYTESTESTTPTETVPSTDATQPTTVPPTTLAPPVVGNVKNVKKTSFESDRITLEWDKVSGATGYILYYCNADKTTSYTKLAELTSNVCTVTKLSHTTSYYFKVSAFVTQDGVKYEGKGTVKKTATQPGKLTGLKICRSSDVIEISWSKNSKATGYRIYRACKKSDNKYVEYKTVKGNGTIKLTDKNVESGKTYYYKVKAYRDLYGTTYNGDSQIVSATCGLCAPNFSMTTQVSKVCLSWNKNKYANGYDLYYSSSKNGPYKLFKTTTNNFYNTSRLSNNKTYYFRVQPYRLNGKSKTKVLGTYHTKSIKVTNKAFGKSVGNTYIEVSIKQQHMWFYIDGKLYCETDVVTGNDDSAHRTPTGAYKIFQRMSPTVLVGAGYSSPVSFWLGFTSSGCGIHDASWRSASEYGGTTYKGNGSHGCVNTPYSAVKKIYNKAKIGNYVVVY